MTTDVCDFEDGCQAPEFQCATCPDLPQSYNIEYLKGQKHITDDVYKMIILEDYDVAIPEEHLFTPEVNRFYIEQNEEENLLFLQKKLAENGLYNGEV